jgi:hypothetical protein
MLYRCLNMAGFQFLIPAKDREPATWEYGTGEVDRWKAECYRIHGDIQ